MIFIVGLIILISSGFNILMKKMNTADAGLCSICLGVIAGLLLYAGISVSYFQIANNYGTWNHSGKIDIVNVNDGNQIDGSFGLFGGRIDEEFYFSGYTYGANNRRNYFSIPERLTTIYEDSETPYIEVLTYDSDNPFTECFWSLCDIASYEDKYIVHVPKGSVIPEVRLDAE